MRADILNAFKHALLIVFLGFLMTCASTIGIYSMDHLVMMGVLAYGIPSSVMLFLVLTGMPFLWSYMIRHAFLTDGTFSTELGLLLHLIYLTYGITLCLHQGIAACGAMFLLYWPLSLFVRRAVEPAFLWLIRERS